MIQERKNVLINWHHYLRHTTWILIAIAAEDYHYSCCLSIKHLIYGKKETTYFGGLMTFLISSDLSSRERSVFAILGIGKLYPFFRVDFLRQAPYRESSCWKADWVQMTKRPTWPPGASFSKLRRDTSISSTPGMLRNALVRPWKYFLLTYIKLNIYCTLLPDLNWNKLCIQAWAKVGIHHPQPRQLALERTPS